MNFAPFWARGKSGVFNVWRWSFQSPAEAQALANQAAKELAARFPDGEFPAGRRGYYPDRPVREEILQEIKDPTGAVTAVITRNSYGCQVLNTARVMFVDIDLEKPEPGPGFFRRWFRKPDPVTSAKVPPELLLKIEAWTREHSDWGWRIYRTRAGLRLLATQALVDADSTEADGVFEALGADPLYRKLCQAQKCYRARLTPKPWRCGIQRKPDRWPWLAPKAEQRFRRWLATYESLAAARATCELMRTIGNPTVHPEIEPLVKLHDRATRVGSNLPLA
jgi:hypothetical protein